MEATVVKIFYRLDTPMLFGDAPSISGNFEAGTFELRDELLTISLQKPCQTIGEARELSRPLITAWILETEIRKYPFNVFRFAFLKAETIGNVIDEAEHPLEPLKYEKDDNEFLIVEMNIYPPAPATRFSEELQAAWMRYRDSTFPFGEPILSATYYVLTVVERIAGNRAKAASLLNVEKSILRKLGEISSTRGDSTSARKAIGPTEHPLTVEEKKWIDHAVRAVLLNAATIEAGYEPAHVSFSDLPSLNAEAA